MKSFHEKMNSWIQIIHYTTDIFVGSNSQKLPWRLIPVAAIFWVNGPTVSVCGNPDSKCGLNNTYTTTNSISSSPVENSYFAVDYSDGSGAVGDSVKDTHQRKRSLSEERTIWSGLFIRIGPGRDWARLHCGRTRGLAGFSCSLPDIPDQLLRQKVINLNDYSLWLNDLSAFTGSIIYGGPDTAKYKRKTSNLANPASQFRSAKSTRGCG